jgi:16S rRNA (uracil1498-N3)-methyltransferase
MPDKIAQVSSMHRFFIPAEFIRRETVAIKGGLVHQIRDVLRLQAGDRIAVLDNSGWEYEVALEKVSRELIEGKVCEKVIIAEPGTEIVLYQALLRSTKFEFVLQKCTEIGVSAFVPVICERCVARYPSGDRLERWCRIIAEAAEQSGRGKLPQLRPAIQFHQACQSLAGSSFIAQVEGVAPGLRSALRSKPLDTSCDVLAKVNLFIGPEGGFSPSELEVASRCGIVPVSLGKRVLRAETAGLTVATAILYESGDLEPEPPLNTDAT